ncbi:TetR/AcrR family transcriptional regulator [Nocardioides sp. Iso805N]|uniref:TetR/AcrR family transcriptional regulator n=1 Tax=Nocardioides sp. Iso805N TaxID=1283287 RepID=UPI00035CBC8A|nr:TetR/AcrR family transcriptional regulator [Nocardioides sp. Iso805N]
MAGEKTFQLGPVKVRVHTSGDPGPAKERLSQDRIVDVALAQMTERGYEAVSMRSIAKELGTGPASLYAHVANKDELDQLLVDRVAREFPMPEPDPSRWDEQLKQALLDMLTVYRAHPGVARASLGMIPTSPGALRNAEGVLALCRAGGVPDQLAAWSCDMFALYIGAVAIEEDVWRTRAATASESGEPYGEDAVVAAVHDHFAALPVDEFPLLRSLAAVMTTGDGDDRVGFAVEIMVEGLKAMSARADR